MLSGQSFKYLTYINIFKSPSGPIRYVLIINVIIISILHMEKKQGKYKLNNLPKISVA